MEPEKNLHLPQTAFNQRANGAEREPELNKFWRESDVFALRAASNPLPTFTLHDGPPYANGGVHMGHVLNKTLKDVINKYKLMRGHHVNFVPGWDCHGLPTELAATKKKRYDNVGELRDACAAVASEFLDKQRSVFERLGFTGEWDNPYVTMAPKYEAAELEVFGQLFMKGLVYRDKKPVHFSPSTQTVLAEAELEYLERTDTAAYFAFPGVKRGNFIVWTTMPWTLLGNKAIAVHPSVVYAEVYMGSSDDTWFVAEELVGKLSAMWGETLEVHKLYTGAEMDGWEYENPLTNEVGRIVADRFVSATSGTGLVHLCPAHGLEDFIVCQKHGIEPKMVAGFNGKFDPSVTVVHQHLPVLGEGSQWVLDMAGGHVIHKHEYNHIYPHDWRTKKPVLFMLTEQFFINVEAIKEDAIKALDDVAIDNPVHRNRLVSMLQQRKDWCISRQRKWGLPIPVFVHKETNAMLLNEHTLAHVVDLVRAKGSNVWFELSVAELLPANYTDVADQYEKVTDTLDVWFDSGTSWQAVLGGKQADVYFEGSDQHRGWFQSSLLTCVALTGKAPYKRLITHGFVLDDKGRKMSKSEGNVIDPLEVLKSANADVMRLWCVSVDYTEDVPLGKNVMKQMVDAYFKLRNSFRFLLGNLFDYQYSPGHPATLSAKDQRMLDRFFEYNKEMLAAYDSYNFRHAFALTANFFANMSKDYFDLENKGILYELDANDPKRRAVQYVMQVLLDRLAPLLAPMVPYLAEDVHQHNPHLDSLGQSVFAQLL